MAPPEQIRFEVIAPGSTAAELEAALGVNRSVFDQHVSLQAVSRPHFRGVDPVVVGAMIAASGTALAALITGLFVVVKSRHYGTITIRDGDRVITVPMKVLEDDSLDRMKELIEMIKAMGRPQIVLGR